MSPNLYKHKFGFYLRSHIINNLYIIIPLIAQVR